MKQWDQLLTLMQQLDMFESKKSTNNTLASLISPFEKKFIGNFYKKMPNFGHVILIKTLYIFIYFTNCCLPWNFRDPISLPKHYLLGAQVVRCGYNNLSKYMDCTPPSPPKTHKSVNPGTIWAKCAAAQEGNADPVTKSPTVTINWSGLSGWAWTTETSTKTHSGRDFAMMVDGGNLKKEYIDPLVMFLEMGEFSLAFIALCWVVGITSSSTKNR